MTGRFRSGSPPKNVSAKLFGRDRVHARLGPLGDARGRVHRHLRRGLVVFAVIALDAVVAGEVALQRRQHGDAQLILAGAEVVEEVLDVLAIRLAALDDEAVLGERRDSVALGIAGPDVNPPLPMRSSRSETSRDTMSWASVKVFIRNTSSRSARGTRTLKIEGCIVLLDPDCDSQNFQLVDRRLKRRRRLTRRAASICATDIPAPARLVQRVISRYPGGAPTAEILRSWRDSL